MKTKKLFLMAAMLLIGTNVNAVGVADYDELKTEIANAEAGVLTTIELTADITDAGRINVQQEKKIAIDLKGYNISSTADYMIIVANASLELKNTGATELSMSDDGDVKIVAIDDMRFPDKVGFVKIDVEGFELSVLQGMHNILKKYKPFIMIEIQTKNYDQVNTILTDLYYKKLLLEENGKTMDYFYYQES